MELDELKASWQSLDRRVQELTAINRRLVKDNSVRKARWRLAPLVAGAVANVIIGAVFAVVSGAFWSAHLALPPVLIAGITTHAMGLVFIVSGVGRLALLYRIDFTRPVLEIQRSMASLQRWEAWMFHVAWVVTGLLTVAIPTAFAVSMAGVRFWERMPGYFLANLLVWLAVALAPPLIYTWSRRRNGRFAARMDAFLTSHSIVRARAAIDEIDEFTGN